jgi:hypothetical protein
VQSLLSLGMVIVGIGSAGMDDVGVAIDAVVSM